MTRASAVTMAEPVFCSACGTVHEPATRRIEELMAANAQLAIEMTNKQKRVNALRKAQADEDPVIYEQAMDVARYWKETCAPNARSLNGPRLQKVIERLREDDIDVADLKKACWGYHCRPNIKDRKRVRTHEGGKRYTDLELICRDAKHVEDGIAIAEEELRLDQGLLNDGASKYVATRCDCGHARGSHALFVLHGHVACLEKDCGCREFDDTQWCADEWLREQGYWERVRAERQKIPARKPAPVSTVGTRQGSLL